VIAQLHIDLAEILGLVQLHIDLAEILDPTQLHIDLAEILGLVRLHIDLAEILDPTQLHIDLAEILGPLEMIKKVINLRDWIPILNSDIVQCLIIYAEPLGPILLLYNCNWAPIR